MISIGERYDFGDLIAGIPTSFGIGSLTGVATGSIYGVSLTDQALTLVVK